MNFMPTGPPPVCVQRVPIQHGPQCGRALVHVKFPAIRLCASHDTSNGQYCSYKLTIVKKTKNETQPLKDLLSSFHSNDDQLIAYLLAQSRLRITFKTYSDRPVSCEGSRARE
jgi:hypothetical protein